VTCHRRYYFEHSGEWIEGNHDQILDILRHACEVYWWFNEPEVVGKNYGRLSFSFTVSARDQWWAHKRALKLATQCYLAIGKWEKDVPTPLWEPLEPHANRGRYRVPRT
jgi:hypothetical protein